MMGIRASFGRRGAIALIATSASFGLGRSAAAQPPPPPNFWDFEVTNDSAFVVTDVVVMLRASLPPAHTALDTDSDVTMTIKSLGVGKTMTLRAPPGMFGIAQIAVSARAGTKTAAATITAELYDHAGDPATDHVYTGFCPDGPTCPPCAAPVQGRKTILLFANTSPPGNVGLLLSGKSRWDCHYSAASISSGFVVFQQ